MRAKSAKVTVIPKPMSCDQSPLAGAYGAQNEDRLAALHTALESSAAKLPVYRHPTDAESRLGIESPLLFSPISCPNCISFFMPKFPGQTHCHACIDRAAAAKVPPLATDDFSPPASEPGVEASGSGSTPTGDIDPAGTERKWTIIDPENYYYPDGSGGWIIAEGAVGHCSANNADDIWYMPDPLDAQRAIIREGATGEWLTCVPNLPEEISRAIEKMDICGVSRGIASLRRSSPISPRYQAPDPAPPQLGDVLRVVEPPAPETEVEPPDEAKRWRDLYNEQLATSEKLEAQRREASDASNCHEAVAKCADAALNVAEKQIEALRNRPLATVLVDVIKALPAGVPGEFLAVLAECSSWLENPDSYERGPLTSAMDAAQAIVDDFAATRDVLTEQERQIWSDLRGGASPLFAAGILEILAVKRLRWLRDEAEVPCP